MANPRVCCEWKSLIPCLRKGLGALYFMTKGPGSATIPGMKSLFLRLVGLACVAWSVYLLCAVTDEVVANWSRPVLLALCLGFVAACALYHIVYRGFYWPAPTNPPAYPPVRAAKRLRRGGDVLSKLLPP